jgi:Domain of unknown function (DUF4124)
MRNATKILIAFLGIAMLSTAMAQEKKIYRWVDKDGKVQLSDQLPPDMVDKARKEYDAKSGALQKSVQNQPTPAEQAAAKQQADIEAQALAQAEKAKRIEQGMMINFETEKDLQRSFDERTDLLQQTIVSLKASIQSRRAAGISVLNELSDMELNGSPIPADKIKQIKSNHALVMKQTEQMTRLTISFNALKSEFAQTLSKYRELKGSPQAPVAAQTDSSTPSTPDALKQ